MSVQHVDALLLIYHHPLSLNSPTIVDHVRSFERYSRFPVVRCNTEYGFDPRLETLRFPVVVLHYSLFGCETYVLNEDWYRYLAAHRDAYKICFYQDEFQHCQQRFAFINEYGIDCIYTLFEPKYWEAVYGAHTNVPKLVHTLTGYVSEDAVELSRKYARPDAQRTIDVGYRARKLPFFMGRGAQEKWLIAQEFIERCRGLDLRLDISWEEDQRIYGNKWFKFLGNCRGTLGVESGVSITDLDGAVMEGYRRLIADDPGITFAEMTEQLLAPYEDKLPLRALSPRCFEAAALRCCQILFEDGYNGILQPEVHYLPLAKDFSNFDEVLRAFRDPTVRGRLVENAYRDLVASGKYSYRRFIEDFDKQLLESGRAADLETAIAPADVAALRRRQRHLHRGSWLRWRAGEAWRFIRPAILLTARIIPQSWRHKIRKLVQRLAGQQDRHPG